MPTPEELYNSFLGTLPQRQYGTALREQVEAEQNRGWFQRNIQEPILEPIERGIYTGVQTLLPGEQPGEKMAREARAQGVPWFESWKEPYAGTSGWVKFGTSMLNPVYYIPVGGWAAKGGAIAGGLVGRAGAQTLGRGIAKAALGPQLVERGIGKVVSLPFKGVGIVGKAGLERIPRITNRLKTLEAAYAEKFPQYKFSPTLTQEEIAGFGTPTRLAEREAISIDFLKSRILRPSLGKAVRQELERVPLVGKPASWTVGLASRRAMVQDEAMAELMAIDQYGAMTAMDTSQVVHRLGSIRGTGKLAQFDMNNQHRIFGTRAAGAGDDIEAVLARGVKVEEGQSQYIGDILEHYKDYKFLTPEQKAFAQEYHNIRAEMLKWARENGVDLSRYEGELHVFRKGNGKLDVDGDVVAFKGRGTGKGNIGGKMPTERPRTYATQAEGVKGGVVYNSDMAANLQEEILFITKKARDERLKKILLPLGKTPTQRIDAALRMSRIQAMKSARDLDAVVSILKRAQRGESLPGGSVSSLLNKLPVDSELRALLESTEFGQRALFGEGKGLGKTLQTDATTLLPKIEKMKAEAHAALKDVNARYQVARRQVVEGGYDVTKHSILKHPAFNNRIFSKETVDTLNKALGLPSERAKRWINAIELLPGPISRTMRTAIAALDLSAPFIQGLPLLGLNPFKWAKLTAKQVEWLFKPQNFHAWMAQPKIQEAAKLWRGYGMVTGSFEYFAGVSGIETIGKKLGGRYGLGLARQTYGRAEIAFSAFGDAARIEMGMALAPMCKNADDFIEVANMLNKMTGTMSYVGTGIPRLQQVAEQAALFAPRYLRSGWMLVGNVLNGGIKGQLARESLGHFIAGGTIFYINLCKALGQEPQLDPTKSGFMGLSIGDYNFSIGGNITSMIRLLGDSIAFGLDVAGGEFAFGKKEGETTEQYLTRIRQDVPFIKYAYSKSSPVIGTVNELSTHTNYFGEELESVRDYLSWMAEKTLPIAFNSVATSLISGEPMPTPLAMAASVSGLQAYPKPEKQKLTELQDTLAQQVYKVKWNELGIDQKRQLKVDYPDLETQSNKATEDWISGVAGQTQLAWHNDKDTVQAKYLKKLQDAQAGYDAGRLSGSEFNDKVKEASAIRRDDYVDLEARYPTIYANFDRQHAKPGYEFDMALEAYTKDVWDNEELVDQYGIYNYDLANEAEATWRATWGEDMWTRLQDYIKNGQGDEPDLVKELRLARQALKPYWGVRDYVLSNWNGIDLTVWDESEALGRLRNTVGAEALVKRIEDKLGLTDALQEVTRIRQAIRAKVPEIRMAYEKFYG